MAAFLPYRNVGGTCAIGVCDRCHTKKYLGELAGEADNTGLRLCKDCRDESDPYKKPMRAQEKIGLEYPRPDEVLV